MLELTNLEPDIVTYGVMAMGCINRQQAQEFFDKLAEKGVRFISIFVSCSSCFVIHSICGILQKNYIKYFVIEYFFIVKYFIYIYCFCISD